MKNNKMLRCLIAIVLALMTVLAVTAVAAEYTTDDGMTFEIITTKESYGVNEDVQVLLLAKNYNTNMKLANISWNANISEGELTLMSGELSGTQKVEVGERAVIALHLMRVVEQEKPPVDDPNPTTPTEPTTPTQPVEPDETQEPDGNATALVIILIVVGLAAIAVVVYLILKKRGILSCFVILLVLCAYYLLIGFGLSRFITASYTNAQFDKFINSRIEGAKVNQGLAEEDEDDEEEEEEARPLMPWENGYASQDKQD